MKNSYTHLTQEERYHISAQHKIGISISTIARELNRDKGTISRELRRNKGQRGYRPKQAHKFAQERKSIGNYQIRQFGWSYVSCLINQDWSPEQIYGKLNLIGWLDVPSIESIYKFIYADKKYGGKLHTHLRCQKKRKKRYASGQQRRGQIKNRHDIDERPLIVEDRSRIGDLEGDTVVGAHHKGVLLTFADRKTRISIIRPHKNRKADVIAQSSIDALESFGALTITYDNGKEFAHHEKVAKALDVDVYFAKPYASWQRGSNENMNGLIRQYLPKNMPLDKVTREQTDFIEDRLNNRPRKTLGYLTPLEVLSRNQFVALGT